MRDKIRIVFSVLTNRMLPKRKLKISTVNPPDILIKINPKAMPDDNKTATAASPEMSNFCRIFVIMTALANDTIYAVQSGYTPIKSPAAIPPNEEWAIASPNSEYLRRTKNNPTTEHNNAIAIPEMIALCIKPKESTSKVIFLYDDAYVPASKIQSIVFVVQGF